MGGTWTWRLRSKVASQASVKTKTMHFHNPKAPSAVDD